MSAITRNSEILFVYDAKMTNPNGDMDNENKPRMDYDTDTNLVSDVRLKRYIRDYFEKLEGMEVFVTEKAKDAKDRGAQLKKGSMIHTDLIDCRLFGAVFAETGGNTHITGPVQFNWGYSLNKVEINESSTITSSFESGEGIGKDFRVKYSVIAFSGGINASAAKDSGLTPDDIALFDKAMINSIPFCRTRSKIGQTPRLYMRVELADNKTFLKDLREYLAFRAEGEEFKARGIDDFSVNINMLKEYLDGFDEGINAIHYWKDDRIRLEGWEEMESSFGGKLQKLDVQ